MEIHFFAVKYSLFIHTEKLLPCFSVYNMFAYLTCSLISENFVFYICQLILLNIFFLLQSTTELGSWKIEDMVWYMGCEPKRNAPTR